MTFLELCQAVRSRVGMQGTGPNSVTSASDAEFDIIHCVSDAWIDIQNIRENWYWMRSTVQFNTTQSVDNYTITDILGLNSRHKRWKKSPVYILKSGSAITKELVFLEYDDFVDRSKNNTVEGFPKFYTIVPWDDSLLINKPDGVYTITIGFHKSPQVLVNNTDTPEMKDYFHLLIVYAAVEKYSVIIYSPEVYSQYAQQRVNMLGQLMRSQVGTKFINLRGIA